MPAKRQGWACGLGLPDHRPTSRCSRHPLCCTCVLLGVAGGPPETRYTPGCPSRPACPFTLPAPSRAGCLLVGPPRIPTGRDASHVEGGWNSASAPSIPRPLWLEWTGTCDRQPRVHLSRTFKPSVKFCVFQGKQTQRLSSPFSQEQERPLPCQGAHFLCPTDPSFRRQR